MIDTILTAALALVGYLLCVAVYAALPRPLNRHKRRRDG